MTLPSFRRFRLLCFLFLMSGSLTVQGQGTWVLKSFSYHAAGGSTAQVYPQFQVYSMTYCHDYLNESNTGYFVNGKQIVGRTSNAIIMGDCDGWDCRVTDPELIAQLKKDLFSDPRIKDVTETSITMENGTYMTWTAPPKKVAFGSEKDIKVSVDFHLVEYPDVQVTGKVKLTRYDSERFYAFPDVQEEKIHASETVELDASKSYKGSVWKDKHSVDPPYYHAPYYDPATGLFLQQDAVTVGNYLWGDIFINLQVKRASIYGRVAHFNAPFAKNPTYFSLPHYPMEDLGFYWGVTWNFFN